MTNFYTDCYHGYKLFSLSSSYFLDTFLMLVAELTLIYPQRSRACKSSLLQLQESDMSLLCDIPGTLFDLGGEENTSLHKSLYTH